MPGLARVHVDSWHQTYAGIIAPRNLAQTTLRRSRDRFRAYFLAGGQSRSLLHVAELDGRVVGYVNAGRASTRGKRIRGEVYELYVLPDAQGAGLGRALLGAGLWGLAEQRLQPALVWVLADNGRARRFYEQMGATHLAEGRTQVGDQTLAKVAYGWFDTLPWPEF